MKLTRRVDLNLGYSCNERCPFCYYLDTMQAKDRDPGLKIDLTTEEAKRALDYIRSRGLEVVDLTGGEPTIRRDLPDLAAYAKQVGFKGVTVITNGLALAKKDYTRKLIDAGVDDFLVSVHGSKSEIHEPLTGQRGSFPRLVAGLRTLREVGADYRTNTVVNALNAADLVDLGALLVELGVRTSNLILFNPIVEAGGAKARDLIIRYGHAAEVIKRFIDLYQGKIHKITVRYIPFCLMRGYEDHVTNTAQIQYDPDEWDYVVRTRIREGRFASFLALVAGIALLPDYGRIVRSDWNTTKHEGLKRFLAFKNKVKTAECAGCMFDKICDGLWKEYAAVVGTDELRAVAGPKVVAPDHFLHPWPSEKVYA